MLQRPLAIRTGILVAVSALAVIYMALIPALFDLREDPAYLMSNEDYAQAHEHYVAQYDVLIHDGPLFTASLESAPARSEQLRQAMRRDHGHKRLAAIPRWYEHERDYYYVTQRSSWVHVLYPFM
jgi:hypothetical protein